MMSLALNHNRYSDVANPATMIEPNATQTDQSKHLPVGSQNFRRTLGRYADSAFYDPQNVLVICQAVEEACSFLEDIRTVTPAKRREIAMTIMRHTQAGMRDPHKLALKGIVRAG